MKTLRLMLVLTIFWGLGCIAPYESARMLPKGTKELRVAYTNVEEGYGKHLDFYKNALGLGFGLGLSDKFNLKMRYEANNLLKGRGNRSHSFTLGPKIRLKKDKWAIYFPASILLESYGEVNVSASSGILYTPYFNEKFDLSLGLRSDFFFSGGVALAFNVGAGFSNEHHKNWILRPDFGIITSEDGYHLTFGLAADYRLSKK